MMGLILLYVEPFTLRGCPNYAKYLGSLMKLTNLFFPHAAKNNWTLCRNFLRILLLDARICLAIMGILCSLIISGKLYRLKEISLLPKKLGTLEKS
jgi:hypothetical protein